MVQCLLLDVQPVDVLLEPPDDVVDEAHLIQRLDDDIVEDRCCQLLDLDVESESSILSCVSLTVVDVDSVLLQVVRQDVDIEMFIYTVLMCNGMLVALPDDVDVKLSLFFFFFFFFFFFDFACRRAS